MDQSEAPTASALSVIGGFERPGFIDADFHEIGCPR
jgi:hypothetical protein